MTPAVPLYRLSRQYRWIIPRIKRPVNAPHRPTSVSRPENFRSMSNTNVFHCHYKSEHCLWNYHRLKAQTGTANAVVLDLKMWCICSNRNGTSKKSERSKKRSNGNSGRCNRPLPVMMNRMTEVMMIPNGKRGWPSIIVTAAVVAMNEAQSKSRNNTISFSNNFNTPFSLETLSLHHRHHCYNRFSFSRY
jgi:hypothetical protein